MTQEQRSPREAGNGRKPGGEARSNSTATLAQRVRLLEALRERPHSTDELREIGLFCPAARVMELREMGHKIATYRITADDRDGFRHRGMGVYVLLREPAEVTQ